MHSLARLLKLSLLSLLVVSCGDGTFQIDTENGAASSIDLKGDGQKKIDSAEAKTFFVENLYPLMREESGTGCASSGCHEVTADPNTFFSVDADSSDATWNWAKLRRFKLEEGDYLDPNSDIPPALITGKMQINHGGFPAWSDDEKALLNEWTEID